MIHLTTVLVRTLLISAVVMLAGCATAFDIGTADRTLQPRAVAQNPAVAANREVAWGGTVVNAKNLTDNTQFEVVAYPLDNDNHPQSEAGPLGRFIVIHPGYLETADYAPGRLLTAVGTVSGTRSGKVGEAEFVYPVLAASRLKLWPAETQQRSNEPRFHFGVGIGIVR
jgi:outer membrane lipoprotein